MKPRSFNDLSLLKLFLWPWKHAFAQDRAVLAAFFAEPTPRPGEGTIQELMTDDDGT